MNVDNKKIIRKLTMRFLKAGRTRNVFVIAAIILTAFMIASVLSIGLSFNETMERDEIRRAGTKAHTQVMNVTDKSLDYIKSLGYVADAGLSYNAMFAVDDREGFSGNYLVLTYYDETMWEKMLVPAYSDFIGHYPVLENEIMLSRGFLRTLGINSDEPGTSILGSVITVQDANLPGALPETFVLCGYYTEYTGRSSNITALPVSKTYLDKKNGGIVMSAGVIFKDKNKLSENIKRLNNDLAMFAADDVMITRFGSYSRSVTVNPFSSIAVYGVIILFLMFTGFLLIYNVLTISVSNDVRNYGLLKTIGATPKQLHFVVMWQSLCLCVIAIPLGAGLAALLSLLIVPLALNNSGADAVVSFSPYIYLGAVFFTIITTLAGTALPARKAAHVSPVEASRYTGVISKRKKNFKTKKVNAFRMAIRSLFRVKRRAAIVFLSLFLGLTIFLIITVTTSSIDAEKFSASYSDDDFILEYWETSGSLWWADELEPSPVPQKFDGSYVQKIEALPGLQSIRTLTRIYGTVTYKDEFENFLNRQIDEMLSQNPLYADEREQFIEIEKKYFKGGLYGIDADELNSLSNDEKKAFTRGEFALMLTNTPELLNGVSEVEITFNSGTYRLPVKGFIPENYITGMTRMYTAPPLVVSKETLEKFTAEPFVIYVGIRIEKDSQREASEILQALGGGDENVRITSRIEAFDDINNDKIVFGIIGGSLSGILGLIGLLNFINVLTVGIISRRREIATLEANGMSKKQARSMLRIEGAGYAVISLGLASTLGNAAALGFYRMLERQRGAEDMLTFSYPLIPAAITAAVILLICVVTPEIAYRGISKMTLVERLREVDL